MGTNFIDQFSLLHFATGIVAYFVNIRLPTWIVLHCLFELLENTEYGVAAINKFLKSVWPGGKRYSDSPINSAGDVTFAALGWIVAYYVDDYGYRHKLFDKDIK